MTVRQTQFDTARDELNQILEVDIRDLHLLREHLMKVETMVRSHVLANVRAASRAAFVDGEAGRRSGLGSGDISGVGGSNALNARMSNTYTKVSTTLTDVADALNDAAAAVGAIAGKYRTMEAAQRATIAEFTRALSR